MFDHEVISNDANAKSVFPAFSCTYSQDCRPQLVTSAFLLIRNFDARVVRSANDYRIILVTTEVLAEGVSLHRTNVVLNYDSSWKGTRRSTFGVGARRCKTP